MNDKEERINISPSNNVAWKCTVCGDVTYHPSAKKDNPNIEIRETTKCLKCLREGK